MFYPYFSYIAYGLQLIMVFLECFVRMAVLKGGGWLRIEIGLGQYLLVAACFVFGGNF